MNRNPFKLSMFIVILLSVICFNMPALAASKQISIQQKLADLEASSGGRLGISAINTANNQRVQYRSDERFPTGSTFKTISIGALLKESMKNEQLLQQTILVKEQDIVPWAPVTEKKVGQSMSIFDLAAASIMYSDNTATFLLIKKLGGTQKVIDFARSIDDKTFHMNATLTLDNLNPTSTPAAMEQTLRKLTLGNVLADSQREQLITWMKNNTTGKHRIRAGVPKGWVVADKTGSGDYGLTNDVAIIWPPNHDPILVVIYFQQKQKDAKGRPAVVAKAAQIVLNEFQCIKT